MPAEGVPRRRDAFEQEGGVGALDDVAGVLPRAEAEPPPAHLDGGEAARVAHEDALHVRLVEALRQHRDICDDGDASALEELHLAVLVALPRHHLAGHAPRTEAFLEVEAFGDGGEEHEALAPPRRIGEIEVGDRVHAIAGHQVRIERTEVSLADQARDRDRAHRHLKGELHAVGAQRRRREPQGPCGLHLLVEQDARLRRLVVRLVKNNEIGLRRRLLEE